MSNFSKRLIVALAAAASIAGRAVAQDSIPAAPAKPTKLFSSDSVFAITIASDIKTFMKTRDSLAAPITGTLIAGTDTFKVNLRPRGHFRRKSSSCSFPPVSVNFGKGVKKTEFAKQNKLKLVTTCWPGQSDYEGYIPQEYMLYRVYNLLTPFSFRARYVRVTYVDTAHSDRKPIVTNAFFVEDQKDMAARNTGAILAAKNAGREDFDQNILGILSLFEFMIGNTDVSFAAQHNIRFVRTSQFGVVSPVAYDFDWSGVVAARYAKPDPSLPLFSVRERLWMSYCMTPAELAPAIAVFNQQRAAITALYTNNPLLDAKTAAADISYFDDFYKVINDPKALTKAIQRHCAG